MNAMRAWFLILLLVCGSCVADPIDLTTYATTGTWYDPAARGQGLLLDLSLYPDLTPTPAIMFGGWFTYDANEDGEQRWYAVQSDTVNRHSTSVALTVYTGVGGSFNTQSASSKVVVGTATFELDDCAHGHFDYQFTDGSGLHGTIALTRLIRNVMCYNFQESTSFFPGYLPFPDSTFWISGTWYDPSTSGQGFIFDIDPPNYGPGATPTGYLFAGWYTFAPPATHQDNSPDQRWYSLQIAQAPTPGVPLNGIPIYTATGGVFDGPSKISTVRVGTANLTVIDCNTMTLDYTFTALDNTGLHGTIHLQRLTPTPVVCNFGN